MILKKKVFFLFIFLTLLQSCSGGRIGNFFESSFNDLEKISQDEGSQKNLGNKKVVFQENKETNDKNNESTKKVEKLKFPQESKKVVSQEGEEISDKNNESRRKVEQKLSFIENKKGQNSKKIQKQKNNKMNNSSKNKKIELQSYKMIFILKDVDPKDPTKELSTILRNSEVNFEIEKIERILDSKNKSMNKD